MRLHASKLVAVFLLRHPPGSTIIFVCFNIWATTVIQPCHYLDVNGKIGCDFLT
jgi:hypothetical protein